MYLTVLRFVINFFVKTTSIVKPTRHYKKYTSCCMFMRPLSPILSRGTKKNVQKFRDEIFEFQLRTTENVISQRQVKIEQRSLAHFSPRFKRFPHALTY